MVELPEGFSSEKSQVVTICLVYNHEAYLRKCLDGFVRQKTSFNNVVLVHDDRSTDGSASIIREYASRYPDIIFPMIEIENQYSLGVPILRNLIHVIKSKYMAICEGDDYWCDPHKLQKQYEYMEENSECSLCCHNTIIHDLGEELSDRVFFSASTVFILSPDSLFESWSVHTSSYFWRNGYDILPEWAGDYWAGDYVMLTNAYAHGDVAVLPDVMSVYNYRNPAGLVVKQVNDAEDKRIDQTRARGKYLTEYLKNNDISTEARLLLSSKVKAIEETTAVEQLIYDLELKLSNNGSINLEWVVSRLNDRAVRDGCVCPSPGTENRNAKSQRERLFDLIQRSMNLLGVSKDSAAFSFVSLLIDFYGRDASYTVDKSSLLKSSLNKVKWGMDRPIDYEPTVRIPDAYLSQRYEVTVIVYSFNHSGYLRSCLDSIVSQKTDFPYAVIVHDDCSSDDSASIILEYACKYPDKVFPIIEQENMYSQGVDFGYDIIMQLTSRYLAFCEGDDKWISDHKLQKQYDHMNEHPECSMCSHNTVKHDVTGVDADQNFNDWKVDHQLTAYEAFRGWLIHLSSFFIRIDKVFFPKWLGRFWFGDYAMLTITYAYGTIDVLPDVMSVYDIHVSDSAVTKVLSGQSTPKSRDKAIYLAEYRGRVMYNNPAIDVEIDKVIAEKNRTNIARAFVDRLESLVRDGAPDKDIVSFIGEQMKHSELREACLPPPELHDKTERYMLGIVIPTLKKTIESLKRAERSDIHYGYIAWIVAQYSGNGRDELLAGIVADSDNIAGWCMELEGDAEQRKATMLQAMNRCFDESSMARLDSLKAQAAQAASDNDPETMDRALSEAASLNCLDPDVLYMRAYLYYARGQYDDALDECGIYMLFHGRAQDIDELIAAINTDMENYA